MWVWLCPYVTDSVSRETKSVMNSDDMYWYGMFHVKHWYGYDLCLIVSRETK